MTTAPPWRRRRHPPRGLPRCWLYVRTRLRGACVWAEWINRYPTWASGFRKLLGRNRQSKQDAEAGPLSEGRFPPKSRLVCSSMRTQKRRSRVQFLRACASFVSSARARHRMGADASLVMVGLCTAVSDALETGAFQQSTRVNAWQELAFVPTEPTFQLTRLFECARWRWVDGGLQTTARREDVTMRDWPEMAGDEVRSGSDDDRCAEALASG